MTAKTKERGKTAKKNQFAFFGAHVTRAEGVTERKLLIGR